MIVQELLTRLGFQVNTSQINQYNDTLAAAAKGAIALGAGIASSLMGSFIKISAETFGNFESKLNQTKAVTGATAEEMAKLEKQALDLGSSTKFSASEAAEGQSEFAKAGFKLTEVLDATGGVLSLAAAGGLAVGQSAEIAAGAINGFGLNASQAGMVSDMFAKSANISAIGLTDIGETAKYAAPAFRSAGQTIADFNVLTAIMGNNLIKGSMAGTSLAGGLTRLTKPPAEAAAALKKYQIQTHNTKGEMLNIVDILVNMKKALSNATQQQRSAAITAIFGQEAARGFNTVLNTSEQQIRDTQKEMLNYNGAAADMAAVMNSGLLPTIDELKGSLETLYIKIGKELSPAIQFLARTVQSAVNWFNDLPPEVHKAAAAGAILTMVLGAIVAGLIALEMAKPALIAIKLAFLNMNLSILAIPLAIAAVLAALFLVINDLKIFSEGGKSAIGVWLQNFPKLKQALLNIINFTVSVFTGLKNAFMQVFNYFADNWSFLSELLSGLIPVVYVLIGAVLGIGAVFVAVAAVAVIYILGILAALGYLISGIYTGLTNIYTYWQETWDLIYQTVMSYVTSIVNGFNTFVSFISSILLNIPIIFQTIFNTSKGIIDGFINSVFAAFDSLVSSVTGFFSNAFNNVIPSFISNIGQSIGNIASQIASLTGGGLNIPVSIGAAGGGGGLKVGSINNTTNVKVSGGGSAGTVAAAARNGSNAGINKAIATAAKNYKGGVR